MAIKEPSLADVCCASIPPETLGVLAEMRDRSGVTVAFSSNRAWVRLEAFEDQVLRAVLPVAGVELYVHRDGQWFRHGHHLPAFDFPAKAEYRPLHHVLTPVFLAPPLPRKAATGIPPAIALTLKPDSVAHAATALRCGVRELACWADSATTASMESLQAALCQGQILLRGLRLPPLPVGERFWGETILVPLGRRLEPGLPASAIREALAMADDELLLLTDAGAEVVPQSVFRPLTRTQLRMALERS